MRTKLMTVRELARNKGVSLKAIYDALAVGRLPGARKIGRIWTIPVDQSKTNAIRESVNATSRLAP